MSAANDLKTKLADHFRMNVGEFTYYLLHCSNAPVTVRSQQVRALNLAWALDEALGGSRVAVIGGGAAGMSFALAAAACGAAKVRLFEQQTLMHLQHGSVHRALHPEIYRWPQDEAYRPVSHLPVLGWSTGTAHEVAIEVVAKFWLSVDRCPGNRLEVHERTVAQIDGKRVLWGLDAKAVDSPGESAQSSSSPEEAEDFDVIVLAVGFGVEKDPTRLPLNSYWRTDPLDQSFLRSVHSRVAVLGAGDGGLIEVLRASVRLSDAVAFYDAVLAALLENRQLYAALRDIRWNQLKGKELLSALARIDGACFSSVDQLLERRDTTVHWFIREPHHFDPPALPINRFLVWRLMEKFPGEIITLCNRREMAARSRPEGGYDVTCTPVGEQPIEPFDIAILRIGSEKVPGSRLLKSIGGAFRDPLGPAALEEKSANHQLCNVPSWDGGFAERLEARAQSAAYEMPPLRARFVQAFKRNAKNRAWPGGTNVVYRIQIWLSGLPRRLGVKFELHPETGRPIPRPAMAHPVAKDQWEHRQWINTMIDYTVRARTSDGREHNLGGILRALEAHYELAEGDMTVQGAGLELNETVRDAIERLRKQTAMIKANPSLSE